MLRLVTVSAIVHKVGTDVVAHLQLAVETTSAKELPRITFADDRMTHQEN